MDNQNLILSTPTYKVKLWNQGPKLRLIQLKLGKLELLGVTTHKHDNDIIEKNVDGVSIFFLECEVNTT